MVVQYGVPDVRADSLALRDHSGATAERRTQRESAIMQAYDMVRQDMEKLESDLARVRVCCPVLSFRV